ncbi:MAG: hypothetical protein AAB394_02965 [Patescibacteria group bacterium]
MRIDQLDRFRSSDSREESSKEALGEKDEKVKKPEANREKITTTEIALFAGLLGLKAYVIYDNKRKEVQEAVNEAKKDFQTQPASVKEIAGGLLMRFGSLALEYQRERQEEKLKIKQKVLSSLQKIATEEERIDLLRDYEKLQNETINESLRSPRERAEMTEEEKTEIKTSIDPLAQAKQQAKQEVADFVKGLLGISRSKK